MTDLQPLQQHQNAVNKANNGVVGNNMTGKGNSTGGKLTLSSSSNIDMTTGNNSASPLTSASVTSPAALTKEARGRVTRSSLGKAPLSLKSCEQVLQTHLQYLGVIKQYKLGHWTNINWSTTGKQVQLNDFSFKMSSIYWTVFMDAKSQLLVLHPRPPPIRSSGILW